MSRSSINWTDFTFNPWEGCTRQSAGCQLCYAEGIDNRKLHATEIHWGPGAPRRTHPKTYWRQATTWNRAAGRSGELCFVFCASMADWADKEAPKGELDRLWDTIRDTPNLTWQLLTKRANWIERSLPADWNDGYPNVWLGVSAENKRDGLPRIDILRSIPAVVRFVSFEPLLEDLGKVNLRGIHWAIIGGESGACKKVRSLDVQWARNLLTQCADQKVSGWMKQLGTRPIENGEELTVRGLNGRRSKHAGEFEQWPLSLSDLKIRKLP